MFQLVSLALPAIVSGWGGDGHSIITEIASRLIDDTTNNFLVDFLGEEYVEASRWADSDEAKIKYPQSKFYHYSNTPYRSCQEFDFARDCGSTDQTRGLCLVSGLVENIRIAADPSVSRETRVDALKFVLHFVGDIHQPLHTGFRIDRGGSTIRLSSPTNTSLHEVWDNNLIERAISGTERKNWLSLADEIHTRISKNDRAFLKRIEASDKVTEWSNNIGEDKKYIRDYISRLATETSTTSTCKHAYVDEHMRYIVDEDVISETYFTARLPVVIIQLSKASSRLAILLNTIAVEYFARLSEQRYWSRSIRVQEAFERMLHGPDSSESQFHVHTSNSFASFEESAHELSDTPDMHDKPIVLGGAIEGSHVTKRTTTTAKRRPKADSKTEVDWKTVAEYNEKIKSQRIIDGIDLTKICGYIVGSKFFVSYKSLPRKKLLQPGESITRAINHYPDFVYFDVRVFSDPLSPQLAKRAFLRARKYEVDASCDTMPFEKRMGYLKGLNLTTSHTLSSPLRHEMLFPNYGKVVYSGEYLGDVPHQYVFRRLQYSRFAYLKYTDRVLGGQITNWKIYWDLYKETIDKLASRFTMVSYGGNIVVITLMELWKKGDGKTAETIFPGFYYYFSPQLYDNNQAWKLLLDGRIFPGPPPDDNFASLMRMIELGKRNEVVAKGKVTAWFEGMQEYCFGKDFDRMSHFPNFGSIEIVTFFADEQLKIRTTQIMHIATKPLAYEMKQNEPDWFGPYLLPENRTSRFYQIILPSTNRSDNHTNEGHCSFCETQIPFTHTNGTFDSIAIRNIALPYSNAPFASPHSQLEDEISDHIMRPRQSIVMITEPESGLVVFMQGFDFIPEIKKSSLGESISFVACLVAGRYSRLLFETDHSFVLVDERILRTKHKALSLIILREIKEVSAYNVGLAQAINETVISSQFGRDLEWFIGAVLYSENSTTETNPRWNMNSGRQLPSALGAPTLPIYQYRM